MRQRLHHDLERWVAEGLVDREQADSIAAFETSDARPRSNSLAEGLGYVGAALAVGAGFLIVQNVWDDLPVTGRLVLIGLLAAAMFGAGWALRSRTAPAIERLTDVLWLGTVVASGAFAAVFAAEISSLSGEEVGIAVGVTAVIVGSALWAVRRRSLELISVVGGVLVFVVNAMSLLFPDSSPVAIGSVIWVLGAVIFTMGHVGWVVPHETALVLGSIGVALGSQVTAVDESIPGSAVAVVSAAALVIYAVHERDNVVLAIGSVAVLMFVPQFIFDVFGESLGAPVALFVTGAALVAIAISITKARSQDTDE